MVHIFVTVFEIDEVWYGFEFVRRFNFGKVNLFDKKWKISTVIIVDIFIEIIILFVDTCS